MEVGGYLSHGAIVAPEYDIPPLVVKRGRRLFGRGAPRAQRLNGGRRRRPGGSRTTAEVSRRTPAVSGLGVGRVSRFTRGPRGTGRLCSQSSFSKRNLK